MTVIIVDYGMGNLYSIKKMLNNLNCINHISNNPDDILNADRIILPGVGSFHSAMHNLKKLNLIEALNKANDANKPILGICLGMQLMGKNSTEGGSTEGLAWLNAEVSLLNLPFSYRVPHMGWNNIKIQKNTPLFNSFLDEPTFYFSHCYAMLDANQEDIIATCQYGTTFAAVIQKNNLFGTQFHPEKSQLNGKIFIENFLNYGVSF